MLVGNVKCAPDGRYFAEVGYSQKYPWVVVGGSASGKTLKLQKVEVAPDPEWKEKMEWYAGGFAGHCANQHLQTWLYAGLLEEFREIRLNQKGKWGSRGTGFVETDGPVEFYDYNF